MDALSPQRRAKFGGSRFAICLGAGIGIGLLPDWFELTRTAVNRAFNKSFTKAEFGKLVGDSRWSLDSWIQAALNERLKSGKRMEDFADELSDLLYGGLVAQFDALQPGLGSILARGLHSPARVPKSELLLLNEAMDAQFSGTSLLQLARVLADALQSDRGPESVLTFNADSLLYLVLLMKQKIAHWRTHPGENPSPACSRIFRAIDMPGTGTPLIHCHGALLPRTHGFNARLAPQHLVFTESSYLKVAADMASWATTLFLYHARTCRMLFVGVSMSDPNLRRWLGWSEISTREEISNFTPETDLAPRHAWITTTSGDEVDAFQAVGLSHLSVEPLTIPSWNDLEKALRHLIGL